MLFNFIPLCLPEIRSGKLCETWLIVKRTFSPNVNWHRHLFKRNLDGCCFEHKICPQNMEQQNIEMNKYNSTFFPRFCNGRQKLNIVLNWIVVVAFFFFSKRFDIYDNLARERAQGVVRVCDWNFETVLFKFQPYLYFIWYGNEIFFCKHRNTQTPAADGRKNNGEGKKMEDLIITSGENAERCSANMAGP